jgi:hypothetical protein
MAYCKERAVAEIPQGAGSVLSSLFQDLAEHPGTRNLCQGVVGELGMRVAMAGYLGTPEQLREWIDGIN